MELQNTLQKLGLNLQEIRVYIGLLEMNESATGKLCKHTNITSSNIYFLLENLIKKGLASYRLQNNTKIFMPAPPEALEELFLEKQRELEEERIQVREAVLSLKKVQLTEKPQSNYKYYEGMNGIKSIWKEINEHMNENMTLKIYTARKQSYERLVGFYNEHHALRKQKKVKEWIIFPMDDKELAARRKDKHTMVRFLPLTNNAEWGIVDNKFFLQYITGKIPRGFLIEDKIFAKTMEEVFDKLWDEAK